mmetsp:Transcript_16820/g.29567  ORF Transcript_16820/g.29567 Transcript_16820/m.29567 type:complete len:177 (-) Transcript_16820:89-619(-)
MAGRKGILAIAVAVAAVSAFTGALTFVAAPGGLIHHGRPGGIMRMAGKKGGQQQGGKVDIKKAQAEAAKLQEKIQGGKNGPEPVKKFEKSPVYFNGDEVTVLNGTVASYKVDVWKGSHPLWNGQGGKLKLDNSRLARWQVTMGHLSHIYGDQGLDMAEANKAKMAKMKALEQEQQR